MAASAKQSQPCLLDTDVLIDFLRGVPQAKTLFVALPADCAISSLSVAELHVGVCDGSERAALGDLLETLQVIDLGQTIAAQGGLWRRDWGKSHGVGLSDALIAATAVQTGRLLLSLNIKHFPMLSKAQVKRAYIKP